MCTDLLVLRTEASRSLSEDVVPVPLEVCGDWCGWKARPAVTKFMLTSLSHRWNSATSHLRTAVGKTQTARELQYLVTNRSWRCSSSKSPNREGRLAWAHQHKHTVLDTGAAKLNIPDNSMLVGEQESEVLEVKVLYHFISRKIKLY